MEREFKGSSVAKYVENYCVMDLETTDTNCLKAKVVEISVIKVRNSEVVDEFSTLINPHCHIPEDATAVNHISDDMVANSPCFEEIIDSFSSFVGDDVIVGYNNASYDMNIIYDLFMNLRGKAFSNNYIDVLHAAKRSLPELKRVNLETVSQYFSLNTEGEHRALKDCYLTKMCYEKIYMKFGEEAFVSKSMKNSSSSGSYKVKYTRETLSLQQLQEILETVTEDGEVTVDELDNLRYWVMEHSELRGQYPFDKVVTAIENVLEDGRATSSELEYLQNVFSEYTNPVKSVSSTDVESIIDKHICLTGEFVSGSRSEIIKLIESKGGYIDSTVKKSTNIVAVGGLGNKDWKTGNYGSKIQRALELIDKGINIQIIEEKNLMDLLRL